MSNHGILGGIWKSSFTWCDADSCHVFSITRIWALTDLKTWHSNIFSVLLLPLKFYPNLVIFQSITAPHLMIRVWSDKYSEIVTLALTSNQSDQNSSHLHWSENDLTARFPLVSLYKSKTKILTLLKISPQVNTSIRQMILFGNQGLKCNIGIWTL